MTRHKHADLMIAYANDTSLVIEVSDGGERWIETSTPVWVQHLQYRIKPEPKKAYVFMYQRASGRWLTCSSINATVAEDERNSYIHDGWEATEIKEVVFE